MSGSDRVFPASADKLRRVRRRGDHPISLFAVGVAAGLTVAGASLWSGVEALKLLQAQLRDALAGNTSTWASAQLALAEATLPWLGLGSLAALAVGLLQTRGHLGIPPLRGPRQALSQAMSLGRVRAGRIALSALLLAGALTYSVMHLPIAALAPAVGNLNATLQWFGQAAISLATSVAVGTIALALVDAGATHLLWLRRHRMTASELLSEQKESQTDPQLHQWRQQAQSQALRETDLTRLTQGRLVVTGPGWITTVLHFNPAQHQAPSVILQGAGAMGRVIQSSAQAIPIPIVHNPSLSRKLSVLAPDEEIPSDCFQAVAEALAKTSVAANNSPARA